MTDAAKDGTSVAAYRVPEPPPALRDGVDRALQLVSGGISVESATPEQFLAAAQRLFLDSLAAGCTARRSALDLLVVDALVTYALERASDDPGTLSARAEQAMRELASR
jgi:hypothetical protein